MRKGAESFFRDDREFPAGSRTGFPQARCPARLSGRGVAGGSVAVAAAGARPDEAEAFAFLVVEEVGVDRSVEARVVQLEAEIIAALVGALGPGGADLGAADEDAVAGSVLAGGAGVGDRSEEHTSEVQSLMRISYAVFCLKKKNKKQEED